MTTMEDVITETRRYLYGGKQDLLNVLDTEIISTSSEQIKVADDLRGIGRGAILEVGLEQMYVRTLNEETRTATVIRGHSGTVATAHANGSIITVNPSYSKNEIFRAALDEIASLRGSGLYQFDVQEFDFSSHDKVYDLTLSTVGREPLFVHGAMYERSQRYSSWAPTKVELLRGMDIGDFPSTYGLKVVGAPSHQSGLSGEVGVRATVAFTLGVPSALDDEVSDAANGIGDHIRPIIAVGAAWRMILGKEARRVNPDSSHGSRRGEEVPPGSIAFLGRALQGMRADLIEHALEHQLKRYAYRGDT